MHITFWVGQLLQTRNKRLFRVTSLTSGSVWVQAATPAAIAAEFGCVCCLFGRPAPLTHVLSKNNRHSAPVPLAWNQYSLGRLLGLGYWKIVE
jgi:hypothetical protein